MLGAISKCYRKVSARHRRTILIRFRPWRSFQAEVFPSTLPPGAGNSPPFGNIFPIDPMGLGKF
jgi:hypothetical protein